MICVCSRGAVISDREEIVFIFPRCEGRVTDNCVIRGRDHEISWEYLRRPVEKRSKISGWQRYYILPTTERREPNLERAGDRA
jgi:hypothetical protein